MTAKQKKLFLLTSMMSVFVMAVAVLFTGGKISMSPFGVRGSAEVVEGSITWTTANSTTTSHTNYEKSFLRSTARGTGIYLYSIGYWSPTNPQLIDTKTGTTEYGLFVTTEARNKTALFSFQNITKVVVVTGSNTVYNAGFDIYVNGASSSASVQERELTANKTYTYTSEVENGTSLIIKPANTYEVDITSVTIEYSCTPGGVPSEKSLSSISLNTSSVITEFTVGETFNYTGLVVTANYSDYTSSTVSPTSVSSPDMSTAGEKTITVSYTEGGVTKTSSYSITVSESEPESVTLVGRYNYESRTRTTGIAAWTTNYIEFFSNGKATWHTERHSTVTRVGNTNCEVYFTYTAENDGSQINISMMMDGSKSGHTDYYGYSFRILRDGQSVDEEWNSESAWSGGAYDRPVSGKFTNGAGTQPTSGNDSGVMNLTQKTLSIDVYDKNASYGQYDTLVFKLAS